MPSIPLSAVLTAIKTVAIHHGKPVDKVTVKDFKKARDANVALPCGLTTAESTGRAVGGWRALCAKAADAPAHHPIVAEHQYVKATSTNVRADGTIGQQWVKADSDKERREDMLARLLEDLPSRIPERKGKIKEPKGARPGDLLAVYPMGDPHLGMMSWGKETGEPFDLDIAMHVMRSAIDNLTTRGAPTARALVLSLGDFFHTDTPDNRTRRSGHHLDVDGRLPKILKAGRDVMTYTIDAALRAHDLVDVWAIPGNHDDVTSVFLQIALEAHYRNEPRVSVRVDPSRHFRMVFGRNLIAATHGDMIKQGDLAEVMAAEWGEEWGRTLHRYWYTGHLHHIQKHEKRGCVIEVFRTLAARDAYASDHAYKSGRDMHRIVLHAEDGEEERSIVTASRLMRTYRRAAA